MMHFPCRWHLRDSTEEAGVFELLLLLRTIHSREGDIAVGGDGKESRFAAEKVKPWRWLQQWTQPSSV